jgi:hypothetical protein
MLQRISKTLHPLTGAPLAPVELVTKRGERRLIWPILGGSQPAGGAPAGNPAPPAPAPAPATPPAEPTSGDLGFPKDTAPADMTADQRAAYWQHRSRQNERLANSRADYDEIKARAARADELEAANATETEKAIKAARDEAAAETLRTTAPRLVRAEFRAAAKGVLTDEQRDALLEDLDLSKYLTDRGEVDEEKVAKKVAAFAPAAPARPGTPRPDPGQGARGGSGPLTGREAGLAEAQKRFPKKVTTSS